MDYTLAFAPQLTYDLLCAIDFCFNVLILDCFPSPQAEKSIAGLAGGGVVGSCLWKIKRENV